MHHTQLTRHNAIVTTKKQSREDVENNCFQNRSGNEYFFKEFQYRSQTLLAILVQLKFAGRIRPAKAMSECGLMLEHVVLARLLINFVLNRKVNTLGSELQFY